MTEIQNLIINKNTLKQIEDQCFHLPAPEVAAFDLDNTLHDIIEQYEQVTNLTRQHFGLPDWTKYDFYEIHKDGYIDNKTLFATVFASKCNKALDYFYNKFHELSISRQHIYPGVTYMLYRLKYIYNLKIIGVTNSEQHMAKKALRELGIFDFFDSVTGPKGNRKFKPDTELLYIGLNKINLLPSRHVWFTGDAATDTICARNAGCSSIRFYNGDVQPIDPNADIFCNSHFQLEKIFGIRSGYYK
jgi:phosphoglycolate phosphatase